eukprot:351786-Chlamydomonas_euryale.AAC.7
MYRRVRAGRIGSVWRQRRVRRGGAATRGRQVRLQESNSAGPLDALTHQVEAGGEFASAQRHNPRSRRRRPALEPRRRFRAAVKWQLLTRRLRLRPATATKARARALSGGLGGPPARPCALGASR